MRAQFFPLNGGPGVDIVKDMTIVGRKEDCDLRLDHKSISKMHCVIVKTDGLLLLRDLGSTNGTRVNGQRIRRAALLPNDQVAFANFKYRVTFGPDDQPAVPAADHTQHIDPHGASSVQMNGGKGKNEPSSVDSPGLPVQINPLSDVYSEDGRARPPR